MENKNNFFITNSHKPKSELKIEPRVLNFEQMNKTLGLDSKKAPHKSKTDAPNLHPNKLIEKHESDNSSIMSQDSASLDDLKFRLKVCQEKDSVIEKEDLISLGIKASDILPGEYISDRYDGEIWINGLKTHGLIVLTNFRLIIFPINEKFLRCLKFTENFLMITYLGIEELSKTYDKKQIPHLLLFEIITKDYREIKIKFIMDEELTKKTQESIYNFLISSISPQYVEIYALQIAKFLKKLDILHQGWNLYSLEKEFERQGAKIKEGYEFKETYDNEYSYRYVDNTQGRICTTYPHRLVVPVNMIDDFLIRSASFRSRERIPVLSYVYESSNKKKRVGIWRSSQCKNGIGNIRCFEDEALIRAIGGGENEILKIFDARPYLNAVANKMNGNGFEEASSYRNAEIKFLEIPNIHKVRDAYKRMKVENNDFVFWLELISKILAGTSEMIQALRVMHTFTYF